MTLHPEPRVSIQDGWALFDLKDYDHAFVTHGMEAKPLHEDNADVIFQRFYKDIIGENKGLC